MSAWLIDVAFLQPTEGWFDECNGLQRLVGYHRILQCLGEMSCEISGDHFTCHEEDWKGVCWGRNEPWMDHERTQGLRFTSQKPKMRSESLTRTWNQLRFAFNSQIRAEQLETDHEYQGEQLLLHLCCAIGPVLVALVMDISLMVLSFHTLEKPKYIESKN